MGRRRNLRRQLHGDPERLRGLVWSCTWTDDIVFVCVRSRLDATGAVRELSHEAAVDIGENERAFQLLVAELEGEMLERTQGYAQWNPRH